MIRINLLKQAGGKAADPQWRGGVSRPIRLISRREVWIGAAFLALGTGILYFLGTRPPSAPPDTAETPAVAAVDPVEKASPALQAAEPAPPPAPVEKQPAPVPRPEAAAPPPAEPATAVAGRGYQLSALFARRQPGGLAILIQVGPGAAYQARKLDSPARLVVDISNCRVALPREQASQSVDHPQLKTVRAGQFRRDPDIARIVLEGQSIPPYQIHSVPAGLEIRLEDRAPTGKP